LDVKPPVATKASSVRELGAADDGSEQSGASVAPPIEESPTVGKGRPTPKRREAEGKRGPVLRAALARLAASFFAEISG